ncbi:hypothetical protein [Streptomyces sp. NBRC 110028]|uniref:hypothetical protein n=1 Tax=Streptomyces sp. NBRC 110028 TaxID=1621260 RepID=UPI00131D7501|nr:hypothetical protein [Streptomyces sp. NBRC 110028]
MSSPHPSALPRPILLGETALEQVGVGDGGGVVEAGAGVADEVLALGVFAARCVQGGL